MLSLNNHISTFGRPLTRFLVRTRDGTRSSQHGIIIATFGSQPKHAFPTFGLTATPRRQFASFGIQNCSRPNASTTTTATATVTAVQKTSAMTSASAAPSITTKKALVSITSGTRNITTTATTAARVASSSTSSSPSSSIKPSPDKVKANTRYRRWSYDENVKMLELTRDNVYVGDMARHFSGRSVSSIYSRLDQIRKCLEALGVRVSDLHEKKVMEAMMSKVQHRLLWSKEQDELLQSLYKQHGPDWKLIKMLVSEGGKDSSQKGLFPRRIAKECRERVERYQLEFSRGTWSAEELERFWKSIREVEVDYRSKGESIWDKSADKIRTFDENDKIIREGGQGKQLRKGFWRNVSEKVQTRNQVQCNSNYRRLSTGKSRETERGRERKLWTVEELKALRDLKVGQKAGWENSNNGDKKSDGEKTSNWILTDEQREAARKFLLQTRTKTAIVRKVQYIEHHAKAHSLSTMEYIEKMIENKERWGFSKQQMKEREQLIAEKMDKSVAKVNS